MGGGGGGGLRSGRRSLRLLAGVDCLKQPMDRRALVLVAHRGRRNPRRAGASRIRRQRRAWRGRLGLLVPGAGGSPLGSLRLCSSRLSLSRLRLCLCGPALRCGNRRARHVRPVPDCCSDTTAASAKGSFAAGEKVMQSKVCRFASHLEPSSTASAASFSAASFAISSSVFTLSCGSSPTPVSTAHAHT